MGKNTQLNIGKEMDVSGASIKDIRDITNELWEKISSLTGEMIFSGELTSRRLFKTAEENEKVFIDDIMRETDNGYTVEIIEKTRFYDANYPEIAFKQISQLGKCSDRQK